MANNTIFKYNSYNDDVTLSGCYMNNKLSSIKFKGKNIKSLAVMERN